MANLSQKELDAQQAKQKSVARAGAEAGRPDQDAAVARRSKIEALRQLREAQEAADVENAAAARAAKKPSRRANKG